MKKIIFYYPSKSIGGAQLLFIRLADYISKNTNYEVYYVDYMDGFSKTYLSDPFFKYIDFTDNISISLPNDSCVIIPANFIFRINKLFTSGKNSCFLIWSIHPENIRSWLVDIKQTTFLSKRKKEQIGALLVSLYDKGFLHFMDYTNYIYSASFFNFAIFDIHYLQIPVGEGIVNKSNFKTKKIDHNIINIGWLGRLDGDKINSVKIILNEIENNRYRENIKFYIIGVGSEHEEIIKYKNHYNFDIEFTGRLFGKNLDNFISENIDIGIAMGTSALEIAKMGKPVIMIDVFDKVYKANEMKYDLIHQIKDYSLGSIYPFKNSEIRHHKFNEALDLIISDYENLATKSYQYIVKNHSIQTVCNLLVKKIERININDYDFLHKALNDLESNLIAHKNSLTVRLIKRLRLFKRILHLLL